MIRRLLIANRGEIVCRIARTARRMGVTAIAVYSDADRNAQHVRSADEAYHLGAAPAAESYLDIVKLIALARRVGADAVHPGYGFLSENSQFAQACADAGMIFVGPPAAAIKSMGSKSASKAAMAAVGVPVAPGYHGDEQSAQHLEQEALRVGFPLIIKASAGGGGKGMQVVNSAAELAAAVESAQRLARTAFADDRLLMERYFPQARHVEVQVFADAHGQTVSLFDRDCSVQRRHQKIIEEAPAPGLRDEVRAAMARSAVKAAQAVQYVGAGTVEFLVDGEQNFYFMEMNTRLQVEHPVTELITGIDLVEWQLRVAQGERLPLLQEQIERHGFAVEGRLYAEDPAHDYLPSVGRISHLRWAQPSAGLRQDTGVEQGDEVSSYYDPMLGKIIAWGGSRAAAIDLLHRALGEIEIVGVATNRALLAGVLGDEQFRSGAVATDFLNRRKQHLRFGEPAAAGVELALAALWCATRRTDVNALWEDTRGWRAAAPESTLWRFGQQSATLDFSALDACRVQLEDRQLHLRVLAREPESLRVECDGRVLFVRVIEAGAALHLFLDGGHFVLDADRTDDALQVDGGAEEGSLLTPLPGTIVAVHVEAGQNVARGAPLVTVEAMKMEHTLTAPYDGVVSRVAFGLSERVSAGAILVELAPL
ncbi:MAG TPA: biotin carboxylase N-terminal domain-containing protein [Steroidobacteraceae bacterium]|jgi:3-methylcrotonyl-CoA carboxylase alpha subunit|nr:biotin carboxylase N-terminal domain-containing protein [Steroidobacteraceae bacterium]